LYRVSCDDLMILKRDDFELLEVPILGTSKNVIDI
jgi:hypothetical protein